MQTQIIAYAQDTKVVGWLHQVNSDTVILLIHGHSAHANMPQYIEFAKTISALGVACCRMNVTRKAVAENAFEVTTPSEEAEQAAALAHMLRQKYKHVIACGHSQGWLSALKLVEDGLVDGAICLMGIIDTDANMQVKLSQLGMTLQQMDEEGYAYSEIAGVRFYYNPAFFANMRGWNVQDMLSHVHKPLLFIFGNQDSIITPAEITKGYEIANQPKQLVGVEGKHRFQPQDGMVIGKKIVGWIEEQKL